MREILLVRHGETIWNVTEVFRGRLDVALNDNGRRQAELLSDYLAEQGIEAIYSSPLQRALQTAEPAARRCSLEIKVEPRLIDMDFGGWQGLSLKDVKEKFAEVYQVWQDHPEKAVISEAESLNEVRDRAWTFVNELMGRHMGKVVLVTHRVVNKVLICAMLGLDNTHFWNIQQDTCGITNFTYDHEKIVMTKHNDTTHLHQLLGHPLADF